MKPTVTFRASDRHGNERNLEVTGEEWDRHVAYFCRYHSLTPPQLEKMAREAWQQAVNEGGNRPELRTLLRRAIQAMPR